MSTQSGIDALNQALDALVANTQTSDPFPAVNWAWWQGRMALGIWADALARDLQRLDSRLEASRTRLPLDDRTLPLDEAFWRIDAACEKIRSLLVLSLGISPFAVRDGLGARSAQVST